MTIKSIITNDKEAFEYVADRLTNQNAKSKREDETCAYRGYTPDVITSIKTKLRENNDNDVTEIALWYELKNVEPNARCAIGHLISDKSYSRELEGSSINPTIFAAILASNPRWNISDNTWRMLLDLQNVHDGFEPQEWSEKFELFKFDKNNNYIPIWRD